MVHILSLFEYKELTILTEGMRRYDGVQGINDG